MTAAKRRAALDDTLRAIDATLADYDTDRRERWIDENLNHPGQMHVRIANEHWFASWVDGDITDDAAQHCADAAAAQVEEEIRRIGGRGLCWLCGGWTEHGEDMHGFCRADWDRAVEGDPERDALDGIDTNHHWTRVVRPDGTGYGGGWEDGNALPPAELVDGVGITVGPHVFCMARLK